MDDEKALKRWAAVVERRVERKRVEAREEMNMSILSSAESQSTHQSLIFIPPAFPKHGAKWPLQQGRQHRTTLMLRHLDRVFRYCMYVTVSTILPSLNSRPSQYLHVFHGDAFCRPGAMIIRRSEVSVTPGSGNYALSNEEAVVRSRIG